MLGLLVFERINPIPALGNPLGGKIGTAVFLKVANTDRQGTRQHRQFQPPLPNGTAKLIHQHLVLKHRAATTKLNKTRTNAGIVDAGQVTGELFISNAQPHRDHAELLTKKRLIAAADIARLREFHILARLQQLQRAGFQARLRRALVIGISFAHKRRVGIVLGDEACKHGGGFLAHQFGIIVLIQFIELQQHPPQPWLTANLPWTLRLKNMQDFLGGHAHRFLGRTKQSRITRMFAVQMIGDTLAEAVKLNPAPDKVAVCERFVIAGIQMFCFQRL